MKQKKNKTEHAIAEILSAGQKSGIFTCADISVLASSEDVISMSIGSYCACKKKNQSSSVSNHMFEPRFPFRYQRRLFDIASVTKLCVTVLVYRLMSVVNAKFSLNTQIKTYLKNFSGPGTNELTVRDLLMHTVEFNSFVTPSEMQIMIDSGEDKDGRCISPLGVLNGMIRQIHSVGIKERRFRYANVHTILLGYFLEAVYCRPLSDLLHTYLFAPLGMSDTSSSCIDAQKDRYVPAAHGLPVGQVNDLVARMSLTECSELIGSAGLSSTTADLIKLVRLIVGEPNQNCYINPRLLDEIHVSHDESGSYGCGIGLWKNFRKNLEEHHPTVPPYDAVHKTGSTGTLVVSSRSMFMQKPKDPTLVGLTFACDFLHQEKTSDRSNWLHQMYARLGEVVFGGT